MKRFELFLSKGTRLDEVFIIIPAGLDFNSNLVELPLPPNPLTFSLPANSVVNVLINRAWVMIKTRSFPS